MAVVTSQKAPITQPLDAVPRMKDRYAWMVMYRVALLRRIERRFVDIAWYIYKKFIVSKTAKSLRLSEDDRALYCVCCLSIISKFWEDDEYVIVSDYCMTVEIEGRRAERKAARQFWDVEWKLLVFFEFQLTKLSLEALRASPRPKRSKSA